jgi:hypothetical protein
VTRDFRVSDGANFTRLSVVGFDREHGSVPIVETDDDDERVFRRALARLVASGDLERVT